MQNKKEEPLQGFIRDIPEGSSVQIELKGRKEYIIIDKIDTKLAWGHFHNGGMKVSLPLNTPLVKIRHMSYEVESQKKKK